MVFVVVVTGTVETVVCPGVEDSVATLGHVGNTGKVSAVTCAELVVGSVVIVVGTVVVVIGFVVVVTGTVVVVVCSGVEDFVATLGHVGNTGKVFCSNLCRTSYRVRCGCSWYSGDGYWFLL